MTVILNTNVTKLFFTNDTTIELSLGFNSFSTNKYLRHLCVFITVFVFKYLGNLCLD